MNYSSEEIARIVNGKLEGNPSVLVNSVAKIEDGKEGDLCFLSNTKYTPHLYTSKALEV